jgi:hypothetical protein
MKLRQQLLFSVIVAVAATFAQAQDTISTFIPPDNSVCYWSEDVLFAFAFYNDSVSEIDPYNSRDGSIEIDGIILTYKQSSTCNPPLSPNFFYRFDFTNGIDSMVLYIHYDVWNDETRYFFLDNICFGRGEYHIVVNANLYVSSNSSYVCENHLNNPLYFNIGVRYNDEYNLPTIIGNKFYDSKDLIVVRNVHWDLDKDSQMISFLCHRDYHNLKFVSLPISDVVFRHVNTFMIRVNQSN